MCRVYRALPNRPIRGWWRLLETRIKKPFARFLTQKVDINARSSDGSTALLWLAHWNDLDTANLLLGAGADANTANDFRMTPLSEACTNGNSAFVRSLLKSGANPNTPVATGETPLMTCAQDRAARTRFAC